MLIDTISLFPEYFRSPLNVSILKRSQEKGLVQIRHTNLRDFGIGLHQQVDDKPFGGGGGMVLKPEPIFNALDQVCDSSSHVVFLSPQGKKLDSNKALELSNKKHLVLLCGHYEGIDQRVIDHRVDEELSVGDVVLSNGCLAALVLLDAVIRLIPGVLGNESSAKEDSFRDKKFDFPHYTRPSEYKSHKVPDILLEGDHLKVEHWRLEQAIAKTKLIRPDLHMQYLEDTLSDLCLSLPVKDLKKSFALYRKIFRDVKLEEQKVKIRLGQTVVQFYLGEPLKQEPFVVSLEEKEFSKALYELKKKHSFKDQPREDLVIFEDHDGYLWGLRRERRIHHGATSIASEN